MIQKKRFVSIILFFFSFVLAYHALSLENTHTNILKDIILYEAPYIEFVVVVIQPIHLDYFDVPKLVEGCPKSLQVLVTNNIDFSSDSKQFQDQALFLVLNIHDFKHVYNQKPRSKFYINLENSSFHQDNKLRLDSRIFGYKMNGTKATFSEAYAIKDDLR